MGFENNYKNNEGAAPDRIKSHEGDAERLFTIRQEIQIMLAARENGFEMSDSDFRKWVDENAVDYSKAFVAVLESHPTLISLFERDPSEAVEMVALELSKIHSHI